MESNQAKQKALALVDQDGLIMMLGTNGPNGVPEVKAILKFQNDGLKRLLFCSNTSARRTDMLRKDGRACLYAYEWAPAAEPIVCRGVMLSGKVELSWDDELRRALWQDSLLMYYPKGPLDPEFVVLQFLTDHVAYYEGFETAHFAI